MGIIILEKMPREDKTGIFVGLNRGHIVTKPQVEAEAFKANKSGRKGRLHPRVKAVREIVQEVCGLAPFQEKKAVKHARQRVGQHKRAGRIRDNLVAIIAAQKKAQQEAKDQADEAKKGKK